MRNKKPLAGGQERHQKVRGNQDYEISFFTEKMKISRSQVMEAMKEVGNNRERLENYFKSHTTPVYFY